MGIFYDIPGQYDDIVLGHLEELWGNYGQLAEVWFECVRGAAPQGAGAGRGRWACLPPPHARLSLPTTLHTPPSHCSGGFTASQQARIPALLARLQPHAVGFQGQHLMPSASRWIGSESGFAPYPTWSTCDYSGSGAGSPDSADWFPAETDFTVLAGDSWFFDSVTPVRPPAQLRAMYEGSVGHNTQALIGLGIPPNGTVRGTLQEAALAGLGAYIRQCYGAPVLETSGAGSVFTLAPSAPLQGVDRLVIAEDQALGQRVRAYQVRALWANGSSAVVDAGSSVGNKKITALATGALDGATLLLLNFTEAIAEPQLRQFAVYAGCNAL